jgi:hypothetical protein
MTGTKRARGKADRTINQWDRVGSPTQLRVARSTVPWFGDHSPLEP